MPIPSALDEMISGIGWEDRTEFPPGPQLAVALSGERMPELSDVELTEVMAAARRQTSWAQALELSAVAELSRRRHDEESGLASHGIWTSQIGEVVVEEVSLALTLTGTSAATLVCLAEQLAEDLPLTQAALASGRIDLPRAKVIADAVRGLGDAMAGAVEAAVVDEVATLTTGQLRHRVKRAIRAADPEAFEERKQAAVKDRSLEIWDNATGTSDLAVRNLTAEDAHAVFNRINAAAQALKADGDDRPIDRIRADIAHALLRGRTLPDAVHDLVTGPADDRPDPGEAGHNPARAGDHNATGTVDGHIGAGAAADTVNKIDGWIAEALARVADERLTEVLAKARMTGGPDGLALLSTRAVRAMADGLEKVKDTWCRTTGARPDRHGHDGYRAPVGMRRLIERRHPTCVFPTCNARSTHCDADHTQPFDKGGITCRCNLAPLCRRHHRLKQHPRWKLVQLWPGLLIWITPDGKWHIITPESRE